MSGLALNADGAEYVSGVRIVRTHEQLPPLYGCTFVPTMGGLHEGHLSLVMRARRDAERLGAGGKRPLVVVSVFVNPTQFNEKSDYERYPRDVAADAALTAHAGADVVFAPEVETMYPTDETIPAPTLPPMAQGRGLEDEYRPGHLAGVCQACARLFDLVKPSIAVFGEKDWQQLQMITWMAHEERTGVEIVGEPTVREPDGLAMASRNVFLTPEDRPRAASVNQAWRAAQAFSDPARGEDAMRSVLTEAGLTIEYATIRDARTLSPLAPGFHEGEAGSARSIICARLGAVRLLDNAPWPA